MKKSIDNAEHYKWGSDCDGWHLLKSPSLSIIQEKMPPHTAEQLHCHRKAQQVFYVLSGTASFYMDGTTHMLTKNESMHVSPGILHTIRNPSAEDIEFLVISEPPAQGDRIEIVDYNEDLNSHIRDLNVEWLQKYFRVEKKDEQQLSDPKKAIIDKGGFIYFARHNGEIVGTFSLLKVGDDCFELAKMAVTERAKGLGIGNVLMAHCMHVAAAKGISKLILYSNTSLGPALHLYRKYGFHEVPLDVVDYERADIKMEKSI